jgi:predicted NUDIX family NTP pyrophosphohydrolase
VPRRSAGLLLYRPTTAGWEVLLVHPGGPLWARRDRGAWSIPKGEVEANDDDAATAAREFAEELGHRPPLTGWIDLGEVTQAGGKRVHAFAAQGELDPATVQSGTFEMEWPPRSGRRAQFAEVDRAAWVTPATATELLVPGQVPFVERLMTHLLTASNVGRRQSDPPRPGARGPR